MSTIDAVLMASGRSRRFGAQNKLLLPFLGVPQAARTLALACGCPRFGRVVLVCAEPAVAALAQGFAAEVVHNAAPELGQRESIRLGVRACPGADGWMFFTCDQPLLDAATVGAVLDAFAPGAIVAPAWQGAPGSPALFAREYEEELLNLPPGGHARDIRHRHAGRLVTVEASGPLALADADTPEAFARLEGLAARGPFGAEGGGEAP